MTNHLEIIRPVAGTGNKIKAALFDFDGTVSTLRQGWEKIMEPLMIEMINGDNPPDKKLVNKIRKYIDDSTGIQTIHQMEWLAGQVKQYRRNQEVHDAWWYKDEYNHRLLEKVRIRAQKLTSREAQPEDYRIRGSFEFLEALYEEGIDIYIASGTDDVDVQREVESIGVKQFVKYVAGAPHRRIDCSKEAVIRKLIENQGLQGSEFFVVGDGKVEIALGLRAGAISIGAATDEFKRTGVNETKRRKLIMAGAHAITGDFINFREIIDWLGIKKHQK